MMFLVAIEEGGIACDAGCPYYEESGVVRAYGGPLKSHCRMLMNPWIFDCHKYNPKQMYKLKVTPEQFRAMLKNQGLHAVKQKKLLPYDHKPSLQIGESGRTKNCPAGQMSKSDLGAMDEEDAE